MKRAFRYLWLTVSFSVLVLCGLAVVVTLGAVYFSGGDPAAQEMHRNLFSSYFGLFPLMSILILFILSFNLCTIDLQIAVSFGARRRDFFLGLQGALLVYSLSIWALQAVMSRVPVLLEWSDLDRWNMLMGNGMGFGTYILMVMAVLSMGCLCGLVFTRSKVWGIVVICAVAVVGIIMVVVQMFTAFNRDTQIWGDLPWLLTVGFGLVLAGAEIGIWKFVKGYCVR